MINCDDELGIHNYLAEEIIEMGASVGITINISTKGDNIITIGLDEPDEPSYIYMIFEDINYKPIGMHIVNVEEEICEFDDDFFSKYGDIKFTLVDATDINECLANMESEEDEKK